MKKLVFSLVVVLTLLASCTSYKNVAYLQNSDLLQKQEVKQMFDAKIMPKDQLTITVNTSDPKLSVPFNLVTQSMNQLVQVILILKVLCNPIS